MVKARALPAQDGQLMPQGDEFELEGEATTSPEREQGTEGGQKREHADDGMAAGRETLHLPGFGSFEHTLPKMPGSRVDFVSCRILPSTVLGPTPAHDPRTVEHLQVATCRVRVSVGDEIVDLSAGDSCSCCTDIQHAIENRDRLVEAMNALSWD